MMEKFKMKYTFLKIHMNLETAEQQSVIVNIFVVIIKSL